MNKSTTIRNLEACLKWAKNPRRRSSYEGMDHKNILIGCLSICWQCGQSLKSWAARNQKRWECLHDAVGTAKGYKALAKLITYVISTVRACAWEDEFYPGALPITYQGKRLTEDQKRKISEGGRAARERKRREREMALAFRAERLAKVVEETPEALEHAP